MFEHVLNSGFSCFRNLLVFRLPAAEPSAVRHRRRYHRRPLEWTAPNYPDLHPERGGLRSCKRHPLISVRRSPSLRMEYQKESHMWEGGSREIDHLEEACQRDTTSAHQ